MQVSKGVMVGASHLIERMAGEASSPTVLVSGFERERHWVAERDRYQTLACTVDVTAVFVGADAPGGASDIERDPVGVRLRPDNPLDEEWFVIALGPAVAVTLFGLELHADSLAEGREINDFDRLYKMVWSVDPSVALKAAQLVGVAIGRDDAPRGTQITRRLSDLSMPPTASEVAETADRATADMLQRLELHRRRERDTDRAIHDARAEFLSRVSHELRTPLNAVLGFTQLLATSDLPAEDADNAHQIHVAGQHLLSLVNDLLDLAQADAAVVKGTATTVKIASVIDEAAMIARAASTGPQTVIDTSDASDPGLVVRTDRRQVLQIVLNLISNATKYDRSGQPIRVVARADGDVVSVAVIDHGPGIPRPFLAEVFKPFARHPATQGTAGTGLGLAVSRRFAVALGGDLTVTSSPGDGSIFTFTLPRDRGGA